MQTVTNETGKITQKNRETEKPLIIYQSELMADLVYQIKLVAKTDATLLITGENGTGKEVMAQLYHYHSQRRNKPMVSINCGAIPSELVESELFGHEKGAFTGAIATKKGCFEMANHGVLFLDEIGEMSLAAQVKLLRAVEIGMFRRVGGKEDIQVDVNLISATNKILSDQVKSGSFREDLFYRLNVIELYVPPLRHRKEDIPLLISYYATHFASRYGIDSVRFDDDSMEIFMKYDWPGNVRQLRNVVERCVVLSEGKEINPSMLPSAFHGKFYRSESTDRQDPSPQNYMRIPIGSSLESIERQVIEETLRSVQYNKTEAARILGFARKTLHNKLDKYEEN
jgi:DNA-binding NtrC family response regulator